MRSVLNNMWQRWLRRPFRLAVASDIGDGPLVVLLHGLGRSGQVWQHLLAQLQGANCRVVAFDLLGFGDSPRPEYLTYDVDDHARAVLSSIARLNPNGPVILVGHSMGCLVAVHAATLKPKLFKQLVLYEMPLYAGLPDARRYRWRLEAYRRLYEKIIQYQPTFDPETARLAEKIGRRIIGYELTADTWLPFKRSLENTILTQTAADEIKQLPMPIDVIYGSRDMLVIRGKAKHVFGTEAAHITTHTVRARHTISQTASSLLATRIQAALAAETSPSGHSRLKDLLRGR